MTMGLHSDFVLTRAMPNAIPKTNALTITYKLEASREKWSRENTKELV